MTDNHASLDDRVERLERELAEARQLERELRPDGAPAAVAPRSARSRGVTVAIGATVVFVALVIIMLIAR